MATILSSMTSVESFRRRLRTAVISPETLDRAYEVRRVWMSEEPSARICPWCSREITEDQTVYPLGGRLLHDGDGSPECRREFDSFTREG